MQSAVRCADDARRARASAEVFHFFCLVGCDQGVYDLVDISVEEVIEFIDSESDTMVGYSSLREVVCPDTFAPVAASDLALSLLSELVVLLLHLHVVKPCSQYLEGLIFVLDLGLLVLACYYDSCRDMGQPYSRVCRIYALAAVS